jgi:hypothetical protein
MFEEGFMSAPTFSAYLQQRGIRFPVSPDLEDYDLSVVAETVKESAHAYRLAQAHKIIRLYEAWKASQRG